MAGLTPETAMIDIVGTAADFAAALDEAASATEDTASRIAEAFDTAGAGAAGVATDISASFTAAGDESAAAIAEAAAKIDTSFAGTAASAAEAAEAITASSAEGAAGMADEVAATTAETGDTLVEGLGAAGIAAGSAAREGVAVGTDEMAEDLTSAGLLAGGGMAAGVHDGAAGMADDLAETGEDAGDALSDGVEGGGEKVKSMLGNLGVPESLLGGWTGLAAGVGGVALAGLDLASKMQTADTAIANSAGISTAAAKQIGTAFLHTATTSEFSGKEMATAFATVAGQLKSTEGHALTTAQSLQVMTAAGTLATAKQIALKTATSTLAAVMQSYQLRVKTASDASDALFEASNATGQSVTAVGNAVDKVKTKLGGLAPSLGQVSALLVDMADHNETGRAAMSALTTAFTAFLKPASEVATANRDLTVATKALTPTLAAYAQQVKNGTLAGTALSKITTTMTAKQSALWSQFTSSNTAVTTASEAYAKMGISALTATGQLKPLKTIIGQLHTQIEGESTAQATATLTADGFSSSAAKLVKVVQAGPAAFDKATDSVTAMGTAHAAASKEADTLHVMLKTVESSAEDWVTELGQGVLPIMDLVEHAFLFLVDDAIVPVVEGIGHLISWFKEASPAALAVAGVIGGMLTPVIIEWGVSQATALATAVAGWATTTAATVTDSATQVGAWLGIGTASETAASEVAASAERMDGSAAIASEGMAGLTADTAAVGAEGAAGLGEVTEGLGGMLGPVGLAVGLVGGLAGAFVGLLHSGPTAAKAAAQAVTALNQKLAQMPTSTVVQMGTDMIDLAGDIAAATKQYDKLSPASASFTVAGAKIEDLTAKSLGLATASTTLSANVKTLSAAYGINASAVEAAAQAANITLKKALDPALVRQFTTELKTTGTTFTAAKVSAQGFATTVATTAKQAVAAAKANDPLLAQSAATAMQLRVAVMQKTGTAAISALVNSTKGGLPDLEAVADQYGITIPSNAMKLMQENLEQGGTISITGLASAMQAGTEKVKGVGGRVEQIVETSMTTVRTRMATGGEKAVNDLSAALYDPQGHIKTSLVGTVTGAVQALTSHWTDLHGTGTQLMKGLAAGITSGSSAAVNAAVQAIDNAVSAAQAHAEIHSPSGLTEREIGLPMGLGVAAGIAASAATVHKSMASLTDLTTSAFNTGGAATLAAHAAAGGTSNPAAIGGAGAVGGGSTGGTKTTVHINITAKGSMVDANQLAQKIAPTIRSVLLQQRRSLGGTTYVKTGLGLS